MNCRKVSVFIALLGLVVAASAQSARADDSEVVVKYGGKLAKAPNGTGVHEVFQGLVMPNGPVRLFAIPNDESKPAYAPDKDVEKVMQGFQAGQLLDLVCSASKVPSGAPLVKSAKVYTEQPGEDQPQGFKFVEEFDHKVGNQLISAITLSRYQQKSIFLIPTHRDANGDQVTDPVILAIAGKLHAGEVVYAVTNGGGQSASIKYIAPWANHFTGTFVKLDTDATVDSDGDTGPAVELKDAAGKTVTAIIPGASNGKKWVPDPILLGVAHGLKEDADVDYITADSGDKQTWLVSLSRAKPTPPAGHSTLSRNSH